MKNVKRNVAMLLSAGVVVSSFGLPTAGAAANVLSTQKYNEAVKSQEFVSGELTVASSQNTTDIVLNYIDANKAQYKLGSKSAKESFEVKREEKDPLGGDVVRLQQKFNGVPVWGSTQVAHLNEKGSLTVLSGTVVADLDKKLSTLEQKVSATEAIAIAEKQLGFKPDYTVQPTSDVVVYTNGDKAAYAYHVHLGALSPKPISNDYFVDVKTGVVLETLEGLREAKVTSPQRITGTATTGTGIDSFGRTRSLNILKTTSGYVLADTTRGQGIYTYDAKNLGSEEDLSQLPGAIGTSSTTSFNSSRLKAAVDAHYFAGVVYDYYKNKLGRNSFDGNGAKIISSVHFSQGYGNAFWDNTVGQMVYGDGDGSTRPFTAAVDVIGHEITHAVTERSSGLIYNKESGALNEAISDIFGTLIEFSTGSGNYLMGEALYTDGDFIRSMSDPTVKGDPDHYSKRYTGTQDSGGVHTNSSIINKAAYLIAEGGTHYNVTVTGIGKDKMGKIFYRANTQYLTASATFSQARKAAIQSAADLYGSTSAEVTAVTKAFDAVGVK